jgi:hypothetical protein
LVSEREQFFPDPGYQQIDISAGQVASPDATREKNVAADEQFILARKEAKTAGAVAGNFQNLEIGAEKTSVWRFFDEKVRLRRFDLELEPEVAKEFAVGNHGRGERVTPNWTTELPLDPGNILDVIDVPVCEEQKFEIDTTRTHPFASAFGSVEENPSLRRLSQIAVRFKNAAAKALVIHSDSLYTSATTAEGESFYELIECSLVSIV